MDKKIKVIAFIHESPDDILLGKSDIDFELRQKLLKFKEKVSKNRLVKYWKKLDELPGLVALSLSKTIKTYPAVGWIRANVSSDPTVYKQLSDLQRENQELREIQRGIDEENDLETLAGLDDQYELSGIHKRWDRNVKHDVSSSWEITVSWKQIFSSISPYLISRPSDGAAKSTLSKVLYQLIPEPRTSGTPTINDQDFQTIKIHLKALGLTDVKYAKTTQGGMGLFWYLTDNGEKLMVKLRSVKK